MKSIAIAIVLAALILDTAYRRANFGAEDIDMITSLIGLATCAAFLVSLAL